VTTTARRPVQPINPLQKLYDVIADGMQTFHEADANNMQIILDVLEKKFSTLNNRLDEIEGKLAILIERGTTLPQQQNTLEMERWKGHVEVLLVEILKQLQEQRVVESKTYEPALEAVPSLLSESKNESKESQIKRVRWLLKQKPAITEREIAQVLGISPSCAHNVPSLLKNSLEEVFRARKGSLSSVADQEPYLKRGIQRATNRLRKDKKNQKLKELHERRRPLGVQERERKQEGDSRPEAISSSPSPEGSLHRPELFLPPMRHADGCDPMMEVL
jgi:hypothetical protein